LGLLQEADIWLQRRKDALPDTPGANLLLGRIALAQGRHGEALGYLQSVRKAEPEMAVAWELLAQVYYEAGNLLEARIHAEQAGALGPELQEARLLHARLLLQVEGAAEEAWLRLSALADDTPEDSYLQDRVHLAASQAALASGRLEAAREHAEKSLVHRAGWGPGRLALAIAEAKRGNLGAASRVLQEVDAHTLEGREKVRYHYWVARFQMAQGRFRIAQSALDQALDVDPNWGPLHVAQVHVDLKVGRKDKVIEALEAGFLVDLERARLRQRLVLTWYPPDGGESTYTLLFDTFGRSPRYMDDLPKWMGVLRLPECLRTGACDEATSQLVEALKLDRLNHPVLTSLGRIAIEQGQAMEALSFLERSLATRDTEPLVHTLRGRALFAQGDLEGADDSFNKAYHYDRDFAPAHRHHAEALLAAGRTREGMEHLQSALKADPLDAFARGLLLAHGADIE
jgi:tetratricopeptide (TPR) repeat protein